MSHNARIPPEVQDFLEKECDAIFAYVSRPKWTKDGLKDRLLPLLESVYRTGLSDGKEEPDVP